MIKIWVELELPGTREEFDGDVDKWHTTGDPEIIEVSRDILDEQTVRLVGEDKLVEESTFFKFLRVVEDD